MPLSWALFLADPSDRDPDALAATAFLELYRQDPESTGDKLLRTEDVLRDDFLYEAIFRQTGGRLPLSRSRSRVGVTISLGPTVIRTKPDPFAARGELRRLVLSTRWQRNDPVTQLPVLVDNWATGLTWDFDAAMIGARVRRAGLQAAGDRGVVARAAGAVLRVQGRGDTRTPARGHSTASGDPEAALVLE